MARVLAESMNDTRAMQLDAERLELEQAIQVRARDPWILSPGPMPLWLLSSAGMMVCRRARGTRLSTLLGQG